MTAAEVASEIAKRFPCVEGIYTARCQTGEPYVMIGHEKLKRSEPEPGGFYIPGVLREFTASRKYRTESEACDDFLKAFDLYVHYWQRFNLGDAAPTLYWRYGAPYVFLHESPRKAWVRIRTRLVLSNLPVVSALVEEYDAGRTQQPIMEPNDGIR